MNRKLCVFVFLICLFVVSSVFGGEIKSASVEKDGFSASSGENDLNVYYFYGEGCPHCAKVKLFLNEMERKYPLHLHKYDIYTNRGYLSLFDEYSSRYGIPLGERGVPALFVSDTFFVGDSPILDGFEQVVEKALEERSPTEPVLDVETPGNLSLETANIAGEVTIFAITVAALVDAVSPCSIAILVFLIGARVLVANHRKRALKVGLVFCLSVFIAYLLFGLGLLTVVQVSGFSGIFSLLVGLIAVLAGIFYLKDVFGYGRGGFAMEVPRSLKPLLMKMLKGVTSPFGAFAMGFVVVCFELPCTGGPYLFVLGQLADNATRLQAIPLLLYYNFLFVLPLIMISLLLYSNLFSTGKIRDWNEKNKRLLRFVGGFTMIALGFLTTPISQMLQFVHVFLLLFKAVAPPVLAIAFLYFVVPFAKRRKFGNNINITQFYHRKEKILLKRKVISGFMLTLMLIGMWKVAPISQQVKASGTIYISTDFTFTHNVSEPIVVLADNIVIDGNGYTLQGTGAYHSRGINLTGRTNVTIKNTNIKNFYYGIYLRSSLNNSISGNNITANNWAGIYLRSSLNNSISGNKITNYGHGIQLEGSSNYNTISENNITANNWSGMMLSWSSNNTISGNNITANNGNGILLSLSSNNTIFGNDVTNNWDGIELSSSSNNTVSGNNITNNYDGIKLFYSSKNVLRGNSIANNKYNFQVLGPYLLDFVNDIDASNTVDGKPVYYWVNMRDVAVPLDAGYVALVNCTNITVQNLNLANNGQGVLLASTTNSTITQNNITANNRHGIQLEESSNYNTISENNITANNGNGISLSWSSNNTISGNNITANNEYGILLSWSSNNSISENNITANNEDGIYLSRSSNNTISENNITANNWASIMILDGSSGNSISGNNITNNGWGIQLEKSSNNSISGNNITANNGDGIELGWSSNYNTISGNNITANNGDGIWLSASSNNKFYHNHLTNNTQQVDIKWPGYANIWDDGYPSGGNYWSDYNGTDFYSGPYQNEPGSDGIGDIPYVIDSVNIDRYPLFIVSFPSLTIVTESLPANLFGQFSSHYFFAAGGVSPYSWSLVNGTLPPGMNFGSDGILNGTPTAAGNFIFTVRVTDSNSSIDEKTFTQQVFVTLPPAQLRIKKFGTDPVPGRPVYYFILLENVGNVIAQDIKVIEFLEPYFSFLSSDPEPVNLTITSILWEIPILMPGGVTIISYSVELHPSVPIGFEVVGTTCREKKDEPCWEKYEQDKMVIGEHVAQRQLTVCLLEKYQFSLLGPYAPYCDDDRKPTRRPKDPNEKLVIADKFIQPDQTLVYPIHFENIGNTSALDVFVSDALVPNLNLSTLEILAPNGTFIPLPENGAATLLEREKNKTIIIDDIPVNITIFEKWTVTLQDRTVFWNLSGIDLSPNATGEVILSVKPLQGLPSGTEIRNNATIQFEIFETITTNDTVNIIDDIPPNSVVNPLPNETSTLNFTISWNGTDPIGEIDFYTLFISVDGGGFTRLVDIPADMNTAINSTCINSSCTFTFTNASINFAGEPDTEYGFIVIASDTAGNVEVKTPVAEAVTHTPSLKITISSPANNSYHNKSYVLLNFAVNAQTSWIGYSLNNQPNFTITGPVNLTKLADGSHNVIVFAKDVLGNMGSSDIVYFTVDTMLPNIEILSPQNTTYTDSSVSLSFTVDESTSWIGYSLDGQANMTIAGNTTLPELSDGSHSVMVYARDIAGNTGSSSMVYFTIQTIPIDTTPPSISIVSPENKTYDTTDIPLTFTIDESVLWMAYSLDGQANVTITGNTTLSGLSDGSHSLIVYADDTAGNTGASEMIYFSIDTLQPEPFPWWILGAVAAVMVGVGATLVLWKRRKPKITTT